MKEPQTLHVVVHYPAAEEPFKSHENRDVTIAQFKPRVLSAFGLVEGQSPEGTAVTYHLYHKKTPLENQDQALGDIAGEHDELQLKLSQQVTQG